jgi:hypothetical protein
MDERACKYLFRAWQNIAECSFLKRKSRSNILFSKWELENILRILKIGKKNLLSISLMEHENS